MDLTLYDVIKGPVLSDKAFKLNRDLKKLVLKVHPHANKPLVKEALEKLFNVKVDKINIALRKGKNRKVKKNNTIITGALEKRATVTLAEGYSLDLLGTQTMGVEKEPEAKAKKSSKKSSAE